jgi:transporter family protein
MMTAGNWGVYTLLSLLLYGFWGLFSKLATNYIDPKSALIYDVCGAIIVGLVLLLTHNFQWSGDVRGILYAILTGIAGTTATLFFLLAASKGSISIVLPITSLYPAVTVLLAFFILKEPIALRQWIGIVMAIVALVLCSGNE